MIRTGDPTTVETQSNVSSKSNQPGLFRRFFFPRLLDTGPIDDRVMVIRDRIVNFYVFKGPTGLVCIDAGWSRDGVVDGFEALGLDVRDVAAVFLTHAHWDHARGTRFYPRAQIFIGMHESRGPISRWISRRRSWMRVRDGDTLTVAGFIVQAVSTPGHTVGSVSYIINGRWLCVGDLLRIRQGVILPFQSLFNYDTIRLKDSIRRLACFPGIGCLLTAHSGLTTEVNTAFANWKVPSDAGRENLVLHE